MKFLKLPPPNTIHKLSIVFSLLLIITGFASPLQAQQSDEKPRMVVMDLAGRQGVSADEALYVSELIRASMVNTELFTVVDRQSINKILSEQAFQQSGACSDTSCTVRIGELLAANKMMTGSVIKIDGKISITVNIIDVEKAVIDFAESQSADSLNASDDAAEKLAERIAVRITGKAVKKGLLASIWDRVDGASLWRSALLPGWGQMREERKRAGYIFGGAFLFSGALTYSAYREFQSDRKDYNTAQNLMLLTPTINGATGGASPLALWQIMSAENSHAQYEKSARFATGASLLMAGIYFGNIIDILLSRPVAPQTTEVENRLYVAILPASRGLMFAVSFQF